MTNDPIVMYMHYTEELNTLTSEHVDWEPYGSFYRIGAAMTDLHPKCTEESAFWCMRLDRQRQRKITNWHVYHRIHVSAFENCLEAVRLGGHVEVVPYDATAFNNYIQWFHQNTRIELVNYAYDEDILDEPIAFDEVAQSQYDRIARAGRSTSIASSLNFVRSEIQKTADECEVIWDQSHRDEKPIGAMRYFIKKLRRLGNLLGCRKGEIPTSSSEDERRGSEIPDDTILSQAKEQGARSAYMLKPRGKAPNRYTPEDCTNRGKKVVVESDEEPPKRSALRRMRNDEPSSSEEEVEEEASPPPPRRKQPTRRGRRS
nr:uncharacterized protein LOC127315761 [Lolium perenne]